MTTSLVQYRCLEIHCIDRIVEVPFLKLHNISPVLLVVLSCALINTIEGIVHPVVRSFKPITQYVDGCQFIKKREMRVSRSMVFLESVVTNTSP